jgi:hypothetical protein
VQAARGEILPSSLNVGARVGTGDRHRRREVQDASRLLPSEALRPARGSVLQSEQEDAGPEGAPASAEPPAPPPGLAARTAERRPGPRRDREGAGQERRVLHDGQGMQERGLLPPGGGSLRESLRLRSCSPGTPTLPSRKRGAGSRAKGGFRRRPRRRIFLARRQGPAQTSWAGSTSLARRRAPTKCRRSGGATDAVTEARARREPAQRSPAEARSSGAGGGGGGLFVGPRGSSGAAPHAHHRRLQEDGRLLLLQGHESFSGDSFREQREGAAVRGRKPHPLL